MQNLMPDLNQAIFLQYLGPKTKKSQKTDFSPNSLTFFYKKRVSCVTSNRYGINSAANALQNLV